MLALLLFLKPFTPVRFSLIFLLGTGEGVAASRAGGLLARFKVANELRAALGLSAVPCDTFLFAFVGNEGDNCCDMPWPSNVGVVCCDLPRPIEVGVACCDLPRPVEAGVACCDLPRPVEVGMV